MIRVACADDHPMIRRGIGGLIEGESDMIFVGAAGSGEDALALAALATVDVMLLDMRMPGPDAAAVIASFAAFEPPVRVIVFSTFSTEEAVLRALRAGASGFLTKASLDTELLAAVRKVAAGGRAMPQDIADQFAAAVIAPTLTVREIDILANMALGRSNKAIARALGISPGTVKAHVQNVLEKLNCRERTGAVIEAQRRGLIDSPG